jgi:hypothetical protein
VVVAWNLRAYEIAFAEDQFLTFKGVRALAMMHIAMHDSLNGIIPVYQQYVKADGHLVADPIVAAAQAAHDVLLSQYPAEQSKLDAELSSWLSPRSTDAHQDRGIALGRQAAAAIIAQREADGWDFQGTYQFHTAIGAYQTTPPWNGFVLQPGFRKAKPFGLSAPSQFRPAAPPPIDSAAYSVAYNEVKAFGHVGSTSRTQDQTAYAVWWMEFTEGSMNRLGRDLVVHQRLHLWQAARMFALLNMSMFDGYLSTWDAKYHYNHWRPLTAIHTASDDGNPATDSDPTWAPLRTTPPFPEYSSAHSSVCNSSFEILRRTFGDEVSFTMGTTTAPAEMPTRSYTRFSEAGAECADSRVMLGFHFR